jgi:hypothetical protein
MTDELSADQIRLLLKLEPNATCGFVRTTYLSGVEARLSAEAVTPSSPLAPRARRGSARAG